MERSVPSHCITSGDQVTALSFLVIPLVVVVVVKVMMSVVSL